MSWIETGHVKKWLLNWITLPELSYFVGPDVKVSLEQKPRWYKVINRLVTTLNFEIVCLSFIIVKNIGLIVL